jgi:hypothetical protein
VNPSEAMADGTATLPGPCTIVISCKEVGFGPGAACLLGQICAEPSFGPGSVTKLQPEAAVGVAAL